MIQDTTLSECILWNKELNRFMVRRITRVWNFDEINQCKLGKQPISKTITWFEISELPEDRRPVKSLIIPIVLKKNATDYQTLTMLTAYFSQDLEVKVLTDEIYKYQFLTKCEGRAFINNLSSGECTPVVMTGEQVGIQKTFLGKEKRLTESEAQRLLEFSPCYEKFGEEYKILV